MNKENREGSAPKEQREDETDKLRLENQEARELVIETPEQKQEREYRENIARLSQRATEYLEEQWKEKISTELPEAQLIVVDTVPLPTLATAREQWKRNRNSFGILKNLKEKLKERIKLAELRFAGIENPEDLMTLVYYSEQNLIDTDYQDIHVKSSKKDREIEKYQRKGYGVYGIYDSYRKGEVEFTIQKEAPYRVSSKEEKKLAELLGKANDPVQTIEQLKRFGFRIDAHTIKYQFEALRDFIVSPEINETIQKLERAGLKPRYGSVYFGFSLDDTRYDRVADQIKKFTFDPVKREQLNDANLQKIAQLKSAGFEIFFDYHLDKAMKIVSDDDAFTLFTFMGGQQQGGMSRHHWSNLQWDNAMLLCDAGLAGELAMIIRTSPSLAEIIWQEFSRHSYYQYSREEEKQKKIENISTLLGQPAVSEIRRDPALTEFFESVALLQGGTPTLQDVEANRSLYPYPAAIPFLELCRELGISSFSFQIGDLHEILANQKILGDVFQPEFQEFTAHLKDGLGYQVLLRDFLRYDFYTTDGTRAPNGGQILGLFHNPYWREGMASGRATELIKKFGDFNILYAPTYTEFLQIPNSLEIMNKLEEQFEVALPTAAGMGVYFFPFRKLCEDEQMQNELFGERAAIFRQHLKDTFGYRLHLGDINSFLDLVGDEDLVAQLFEEENIAFIKETFKRIRVADVFNAVYDLETLRIIREVDPVFRPLIRTIAKDFGFYVDIDYRNRLPQLQAISQNETAILSTAKKLQECGFSFYLMESIPQILEIVNNDLLGVFVQFKDQPNLHTFLWRHIKELSDAAREKRKDYVEIFIKIDNSPSQEIQRLKDYLLEQVLVTDNPEKSYQNIEDVFVKNNLPTIGKVYKVFEILHTPAEITRKLTRGNPGSPILTAAGTRRRASIIYSDLLRAHTDSANRSLRQYVETLRDGEKLLSRVDDVGIDALSPEEQKKLAYVLEKFHTLFFNSTLGKNMEMVRDDLTLGEHYQYLRTNLGVREGSSLTARIAEMFLRPLGIASLDEVLTRMREAKRTTHQRNLDFYSNNQGGFVLREGDLLKGTPSQYVPGILQNASVAKEFLGSADQKSDQTPFDADVSRVSEEDMMSGFSEAVRNSLAIGYGDLVLAIRDRGQFQYTEIREKRKYNPDKFELFPIGEQRHYGIRTGLPSTEIDFLIVTDSLINNQRSLEKIYYEIAQNGWYIPVCDTDGKVIFTPVLYDGYRKTFNGLDRYDGDPLEMRLINASDPLLARLQGIWETKKNDLEKLLEVSLDIRRVVESALGELGIRLKEEFDSSILGAELLNIGSTGRNTNVPASYDFDLTLTLDGRDFLRAQEIATKVKEGFRMEQDESHAEANGYYQLRAKGVSRIGDTILESPIDIDIGFAKKSDLAVFGSHDAVREKLDWILNNRGEKAYQQIVSTIILTKEILDEGNAYKRIEHGGFGGIGVENWILYHNGDMQEAFQSFRDAAYENGVRISFDQFRQKYKILNPGMNVKNLYHDNYIENLKPEGYGRMLNVVESFLQ